MVQLIKEELQKANFEALGKVGIAVRRSMEEEKDYLTKTSVTRPLGCLSELNKYSMDMNIMIQLSHLMIATGVNEGQNYTQLAVAIGQRIRNFYKLKPQTNKAIQLGAFVLNAYAMNDLVVIKLVNDYRFNTAKTVYKVYAGHRGKLRNLKDEFNEVSDPYKPLLKQAVDWEYGVIKSEIGEEIKLIKDANVDTSAMVNKVSTPIVINAINKKQKIAYYVKPGVFEVYKWALKTNQECFEHCSVETIDSDRKAAKKREALAILDATEPYVGKTFYQQYQTDNRGRLYPLSAYLNELNSDNAKGMLSFANGQPLGKRGLDNLKHHISNMYGEDKLTHEGRVKFVDDRYQEFVSYGANPYENKGWMKAAEPFQFLNAVMELYNFDTWVTNNNKEEDFISTTICYRDGSNNGLQWLFSLAKDEQNAHLVNVTKTPDGKPGDMYQHVATGVKMQLANREYTTEERLNYEVYYKNGIERIRNITRDLENKLGKINPLVERKRRFIKWYQKRYKEELKKTDYIYWHKADENGFDKKIWRKTVKRNVMTYGYSATKQGMGEQIIQDTRDIENKYLANKQHSAARVLGATVYTTIETQFPKVSAAMKLFKDNCGLYMKKTGKQYMHKTVISNFPFVQKYVKYKKGQVWVERVLVQNNERQLKYENISFVVHTERAEPDIAKAKAGISPNTIHNLDSLHLMLVIDQCDFDIVSAHDSYGCHAGNVDAMQNVIREQFKRVIDADPIQDILIQTGNLIDMIEVGKLKSSAILDSEFAFS